MPITPRSGPTILLLIAAIVTPARAAGPASFVLWERSIANFEAQDKKSPPPQGAIVFAGSSSIVYWDLKCAFPDLTTVNRGFGGSQVADSTHFAPRIILPLHPREIVFYAGDNDISLGKSPETVANDFRAFVAAIHKDLPQTKITFLAIKPSLARWKFINPQRTANARVEAICKADSRLRFIDTAAPILGPDAKPRADLLRKDGLHLSEKGYDVWNAILKPILK
jgi:lysophospholipase L1-like esterase